MTGLEKITERILLESKQKCEKILEDGALQVKDILSAAKLEADEKAKALIDSAEAEASRKNAIAKSRAESITRNRYLEIRNAILNDIISAAYESLEKLSDEEYFGLIKKLCYKHIQSGECVMYMSGSDLFRLPKDFEDEINSTVFETAAVHVSDVPADIENGFILVYDGFEVNCTLKAIFDESMENLKYTLSRVLFN